jgi:Ca2+/Na+ antiporter
VHLPTHALIAHGPGGEVKGASLALATAEVLGHARQAYDKESVMVTVTVMVMVMVMVRVIVMGRVMVRVMMMVMVMVVVVVVVTGARASQVPQNKLGGDR